MSDTAAALVLDRTDYEQLREIAERALRPPRGQSPDDVIMQSLRAAGFGSYRDRAFRLAYAQCCSLVIELWPEPAGPLTPEFLWHAYTSGLSQAEIGRRRLLTREEVRRQSHQLGFLLTRDPAEPTRFIVAEGPCLFCGEELPVASLDDAHLCAGCR